MRTTDFKEGVSEKATLIILSVATVAFVALCGIQVFVFSVLGAAAFATLLYFDKKRVYTILAAILSLAAVAAYAYPLVPAALLTLSVGGCLTVFFVKGFSKFDAVCVSVLQYLLMFVLILWLGAAQTTGDFSPSAAVAFYAEELQEIKAEFVSSFDEMIRLYVNENAEELSLSAENIGNSVIELIPSIFAIMSFVMVGCAAKLFTALVSRLGADRGEAIHRWNFTTPMLFAWFYGALTVLSLIFGAGSSAFSLSVINLQMLFMFVYAYIGFKYLRFTSRRLHRRNPMAFFILIMFLFLPSLALQLLAIEGMIAVISAYRLQKHRRQKHTDV